MIQYAAYWLAAGLAVPVFWALPPAWRMAFLGLASFAFVLAIEPATALTMAGLAALVYALNRPGGRSLVRGRATLLCIVLLGGYLAWFKYLPVLAGALSDGYDFAALLLPLGISYFAFKLIHYAVESGRGTLPAHGPGDFLAFVFLVPIFTAGPIQRFDLFLTQRSEIWEPAHAVEGLTRIAQGLIKKFVLGAAVLALMGRVAPGGVTELLADLATTPPPVVVAFLILAYLYVYMDFAGYTDIAIGTSRLFGLRIMENFNLPVLAPNIGTLWKRWHMSLAAWCQSYIYMPMLGLTRNPYLAVFASFTVMGLWHAASLNWLAWGLYNAAGVAVFQWWSSTARRRKWAFVKTRPYAIAGYPLTFLFFAGSFAFTLTDQEAGLWGAVRLLARCLFITLPESPGIG
jgi:alginate O-acetyltransferase complex protein AlgI